MNQIKVAIFVTVFAACISLALLGSRFSLTSTSLNTSSTQKNQLQEQGTNEQRNQQAVQNRLETRCSLASKFPEEIQRWCEFIEKGAVESGLEPNLIASLMLEESGGNPLAYSRDGAVGLLQVMPRDGLAEKFLCPNGPCFAARPSIAQLQEPEFNIRYGALMLAGLIKRFGNLRDGLKAYGPSGVDFAYADTVLAIHSSYQ